MVNKVLIITLSLVISFFHEAIWAKGVLSNEDEISSKSFQLYFLFTKPFKSSSNDTLSDDLQRMLSPISSSCETIFFPQPVFYRVDYNPIKKQEITRLFEKSLKKKISSEKNSDGSEWFKKLESGVDNLLGKSGKEYVDSKSLLELAKKEATLITYGEILTNNSQTIPIDNKNIEQILNNNKIHLLISNSNIDKAFPGVETISAEDIDTLQNKLSEKLCSELKDDEQASALPDVAVLYQPNETVFGSGAGISNQSPGSQSSTPSEVQEIKLNDLLSKGENAHKEALKSSKKEKRSGWYEMAEKYYSEAIQLAENANLKNDLIVKLYNRRAGVNKELKRADRVEPDYQKALAITPEDYYVHFNYAIFLMGKGDSYLGTAIEELDKALTFDFKQNSPKRKIGCLDVKRDFKKIWRRDELRRLLKDHSLSC